mgnify:FL=1
MASRESLPDVAADRSLEQVVDMATLPGIVGASFAMPDVRWGYGFPIGRVAATDVEAGGVVPPDGVCFGMAFPEGGLSLVSGTVPLLPIASCSAQTPASARARHGTGAVLPASRTVRRRDERSR